MTHGRVDEYGRVLVPITLVLPPEKEIEALLDTGFNGELVLAKKYKRRMKLTRVGSVRAELADGQIIEDDLFVADIIFDSEAKLVLASFADSEDSLIGTELLSEKVVVINFVSGDVTVDQGH
jgi:clan AA aspartic protease